MRQPEISVRKASGTDVRGILECLRLAFEPYRERYTAAAYADTVMTTDTIGQRLNAMTVFVAVARIGEIAGTVGCQVLEGGEGHIRGMAVCPVWLGTGVAQSLLDAAERELRQCGCSTMTLDTTEPLERAVRFYERNGFRASGVVRDFFGMPLLEYAKPLA